MFPRQQQNDSQTSSLKIHEHVSTKSTLGPDFFSHSLFPRQQALPSSPFPKIQMIPQVSNIHEHVSTKTTILPSSLPAIQMIPQVSIIHQHVSTKTTK